MDECNCLFFLEVSVDKMAVPGPLLTDLDESAEIEQIKLDVSEKLFLDVCIKNEELGGWEMGDEDCNGESSILAFSLSCTFPYF